MIAKQFRVMLLPFLAGLAPTIYAQECPPDVVKADRNASVAIHARKTTKETGAVEDDYGTGFVVSKSGYVLTAKHVVEKRKGDDEVVIDGAIGSRKATPSPLSVIDGDELHDIALLKFEDTSRKYNPVLLGDPGQVQVGTLLCSVGYPLETIEFTHVTGSLSGQGGPDGRWLTQMPSNKGESGAPVFLKSGEVVAMKVGGYSNVQNVNFLIPVNLARHVLILVPDLEGSPWDGFVPLSSWSRWLNLGVSALVLLVGLLIFRFLPPPIFQLHPYTQRAFIFWLCQWSGFTLLWLLIWQHPTGETDLRGILAAVDLQSIFALGFFLAFSKENDFRLGPTILDLIIVFVLVLASNLVFYELGITGHLGQDWRSVWIFGSEILSASSLGLVALAFVWRYAGVPGYVFAFVTVVYLVLQRPIYQGTFVHAPVHPGWSVALSMGKLIYALVFYGMFFLPPTPKLTGPLNPPTFGVKLGPWVLKPLVRILVLVGGGVLTFLIAFLNKELSALVQAALAHLTHNN